MSKLSTELIALEVGADLPIALSGARITRAQQVANGELTVAVFSVQMDADAGLYGDLWGDGVDAADALKALPVGSKVTGNFVARRKDDYVPDNGGEPRPQFALYCKEPVEVDRAATFGDAFGIK